MTEDIGVNKEIICTYLWQHNILDGNRFANNKLRFTVTLSLVLKDTYSLWSNQESQWPICMQRLVHSFYCKTWYNDEDNKNTNQKPRPLIRLYWYSFWVAYRLHSIDFSLKSIIFFQFPLIPLCRFEFAYILEHQFMVSKTRWV